MAAFTLSSRVACADTSAVLTLTARPSPTIPVAISVRMRPIRLRGRSSPPSHRAIDTALDLNAWAGGRPFEVMDIEQILADERQLPVRCHAPAEPHVGRVVSGYGRRLKFRYVPEQPVERPTRDVEGGPGLHLVVGYRVFVVPFLG